MNRKDVGKRKVCINRGESEQKGCGKQKGVEKRRNVECKIGIKRKGKKETRKYV